MSRDIAIDNVTHHFERGAFLETLRQRVAFRTESQEPDSGPLLRAYLSDEIAPALAELGFGSRLYDNPVAGAGPFLVAQRHESDDLPTVLTYGHGDVVRGYDAQWRGGLSPWQVTVEGDHWYGRGTADNKGQHSINLAALRAVLDARGGRLGFNLKVLFETGEETGSPGLHAFCASQREVLAADLLIASDGPRLGAAHPTLFLGSRGLVNFKLSLQLRDGGHHSGNWGGLLRNPGVVLANAIASMVDRHGRILVEGLRPPPLPDAVRRALAGIAVGGNPGEPEVDADYGEPGLTPAERVFGWNNLEVLAFKTGNPDKPVNAIPPYAFAFMQIRFVVGTPWEDLERIVRDHLDAHGFAQVQIEVERGMPATRVDPDDPWVQWALASLQRTTGKAPVLLPNLGGTLPNDVFAEVLGLPTLWVPHSYPGCSQHAPNEHLLGSVAREGLRIMAGLFWDLGEAGPAVLQQRQRSNNK
ncbi:M20 family metallopeptidase [Pandoraea sp.]|uniref:M20 family metallopeptidase n=1 Tax=Pandoraea sp. TaxID=1883445 RepID=UPI001214E844|nr:M20 family metallopeptidase [Pandoraea sp.]MBU6493115.1 M20 family metallopeptidase [Burkholderiales bacterium]MDE2287412.1 M20 family metallopeptidase [Burkholderiales bacterium]MDE2610198.1 M20 family metallopeptidase [Burkholderiales bacterium]TAL52675.1 MAG: M20 peptidase family dipeptidase [Pandoraea sp.]TAM16322.1 MAG: M20 peptidase family dipeptidase [Pandoraea sp.]